MRVQVLDLGLLATVVLLDQASKALVRAVLPLHASVNVVPHLVDLTHVQNTGAAFGILNAAEFPLKGPIIAAVSTLALVAIALYAARLSPHERWARFALLLILGGAVGNLIDRIVFGYVVDFVDMYWREYHFWAFNVADSAITVGVATMIVDLVRAGDRDVSKAV